MRMEELGTTTWNENWYVAYPDPRPTCVLVPLTPIIELRNLCYLIPFSSASIKRDMARETRTRRHSRLARTFSKLFDATCAYSLETD